MIGKSTASRVRSPDRVEDREPVLRRGVRLAAVRRFQGAGEPLFVALLERPRVPASKRAAQPGVVASPRCRRRERVSEVVR